jgi:uncharacterized protein YjbI with pentapeptide repeats
VFKQTKLSTSSFSYGLFSEASFDSCEIIDCDLSGALMSRSELKRTILKDDKLVTAELFMTNMRGIDLSKCDISGIVLSRELSELRGVTVNFEQAADLAKLLGLIVK